MASSGLIYTAMPGGRGDDGKKVKQVSSDICGDICRGLCKSGATYDENNQIVMYDEAFSCKFFQCWEFGEPGTKAILQSYLWTFTNLCVAYFFAAIMTILGNNLTWLLSRPFTRPSMRSHDQLRCTH